MNAAVEQAPRDRLLAAADMLMHRRGFVAVGVAELCEAADTRKGSFAIFEATIVALMSGVKSLRTSTPAVWPAVCSPTWKG